MQVAVSLTPSSRAIWTRATAQGRGSFSRCMTSAMVRKDSRSLTPSEQSMNLSPGWSVSCRSAAKGSGISTSSMPRNRVIMLFEGDFRACSMVILPARYSSHTTE